MADNREVNDTTAKLPRTLVERLTLPFSRFVQIDSSLEFEGDQEKEQSRQENSARGRLVLGELGHPRLAALSIPAAAGEMLGPAAILCCCSREQRAGAHVAPAVSFTDASVAESRIRATITVDG